MHLTVARTMSTVLKVSDLLMVLKRFMSIVHLQLGKIVMAVIHLEGYSSQCLLMDILTGFIMTGLKEVITYVLICPVVYVCCCHLLSDLTSLMPVPFSN